MSVSLSKGQRVDLTKGRPSLKNILVGLGWDINHYDGEADFDLDASVFMTKENDKVGKDEDFIFYASGRVGRKLYVLIRVKGIDSFYKPYSPYRNQILHSNACVFKLLCKIDNKPQIMGYKLFSCFITRVLAVTAVFTGQGNYAHIFLPLLKGWWQNIPASYVKNLIHIIKLLPDFSCEK